jgi:hypothetical protein
MDAPKDAVKINIIYSALKNLRKLNFGDISNNNKQRLISWTVQYTTLLPRGKDDISLHNSIDAKNIMFGELQLEGGQVDISPTP